MSDLGTRIRALKDLAATGCSFCDYETLYVKLDDAMAILKDMEALIQSLANVGNDAHTRINKQSDLLLIYEGLLEELQVCPGDYLTGDEAKLYHDYWYGDEDE